MVNINKPSVIQIKQAILHTGYANLELTCTLLPPRVNEFLKIKCWHTWIKSLPVFLYRAIKPSTERGTEFRVQSMLYQCMAHLWGYSETMHYTIAQASHRPTGHYIQSDPKSESQLIKSIISIQVSLLWIPFIFGYLHQGSSIRRLINFMHSRATFKYITILI